MCPRDSVHVTVPGVPARTPSGRGSHALAAAGVRARQGLPAEGASPGSQPSAGKAGDGGADQGQGTQE